MFGQSGDERLKAKDNQEPADLAGRPLAELAG